MFERPNDQRGFIHKRLLGAVGGLLKGGPLGAAAGFLAKPKARPTLPAGAAPRLPTESAKQIGRAAKFGGPEAFATVSRPLAPGVDCRPPQVLDPRTGRCRTPRGGIIGATQRALPGGFSGFIDDNGAVQTFDGGTPVGDAVNGRYGAALVPGIMQIERSVCLKGMTLGNDGLCYNKGSISNTQRMWPRGRRPLLTGGDMRAIGIAARAGSKLERTTKRLRTLGMMKRLPAPRKASAHAHAKPIAAVSV